MPPSVFLPVPGPLVDEHRRITREWLFFQQTVVDQLASGITGPGSSLDGQIVLFDGTSGQVLRGATGTGFVFATNGVYSVLLDPSSIGYWSEVTNGDPTNPELVFDSFGNTIDVWVPV